MRADEKPKTKAEQLAFETDRSIKRSSVDDVHLAAVQTRSQKQTDKNKPLKIRKVEALNVSCEEFKLTQKEDENWGKYWKLDERSSERESEKNEWSGARSGRLRSGSGSGEWAESAAHGR